MDSIKKLNRRNAIFINKKVTINVGIFFGLIIISLYVSKRNYLLFHTGVEIFSAIIAYNILIVTLNYHNTSNRGNVFLLGVAYGFIGGVDLLHALSYEGMGVFNYTDINIANQLWLLARYLEASTLLVFILSYNKRFKPLKIVCSYGIVSGVFLLLIFYWGIVPDCYVKNQGLTQFKIVNEYVIALILLIGLYSLYRRRQKLSYISYELVMIAMVLTLVSEIFFTLYFEFRDMTHVIGHILKMYSFYLLFKSVNTTYIIKPQNMLFQENNQLKLKAVKCQKDNKKLKDEITQRRLNELRTLSNKKILESILESVEDGIILVSTKNKKKAIHWNKRFLEIWGMPKEIIEEGDIDKMLQSVKDQLKNPEEFVLNANDMYDNRQSTCDILEFKDGRIMERYSNPLVVKEEVIGKVLSFRDITERKKAEEIKKENEINKRLLKEERKYDQMKTQFFTNLSHELKTPINVLLGNVQLLRVYLDNDTVDESNKKIAKYLNSMWQNCYRLLRLINNLTDIVKIDSGYFDVTLKNYNIVSIVEEITLSVADYIENMGIDLVFDTDTEEKIIACDPDKIERILLNLLSNAVKFTDRGGRIIVSMNDLKDKVRVTVKDTGIGIPMDKQSQIFDRFKKANEDLIRNYQGTGIGLSLVKALVEMHEGTIELESNYGDGSEFIIELPSRMVSQINETPIKEYMDIHDRNIEKLNIEFSDIYS